MSDMANNLGNSLGGAGLFNSLIKSAFAQLLDFTKNKQTKIQNSDSEYIIQISEIRNS